jgi:hypothetical protein
MELSNIAIFALIGALVAAIVAGGVLSMMDEDATTTSLGGGAVVGGLLGAATAYLQGTEVKELVPDSIKHVMSGGGLGGSSSYPDMKVGLPAF